MVDTPFPPALVPAVLLALALAILLHVLLSGGKRRRATALVPGEKVWGESALPPPA